MFEAQDSLPASVKLVSRVRLEAALSQDESLESKSHSGVFKKGGTIERVADPIGKDLGCQMCGVHSISDLSVNLFYSYLFGRCYSACVLFLDVSLLCCNLWWWAYVIPVRDMKIKM